MSLRFRRRTAGVSGDSLAIAMPPAFSLWHAPCEDVRQTIRLSKLHHVVPELSNICRRCESLAHARKARSAAARRAGRAVVAGYDATTTGRALRGGRASGTDACEATVRLLYSNDKRSRGDDH